MANLEERLAQWGRGCAEALPGTAPRATRRHGGARLFAHAAHRHVGRVLSAGAAVRSAAAATAARTGPRDTAAHRGGARPHGRRRRAGRRLGAAELGSLLGLG